MKSFGDVFSLASVYSSHRPMSYGKSGHVDGLRLLHSPLTDGKLSDELCIKNAKKVVHYWLTDVALLSTCSCLCRLLAVICWKNKVKVPAFTRTVYFKTTISNL